MEDARAARDAGGWEIVESVALELDFGISIACDRLPAPFRQERSRQIAQQAAAWREDWAALIGRPTGWITICEYLADLAGVLTERDYGRASMAMRELGQQDALERLIDKAARYGLAPHPDLPPAERLPELYNRLIQARRQHVGFSEVPRSAVLRHGQHEIARAARFLAGGDLHTRGWHLIDRFYYEIYAPWRAEQQPVIDQAYAEAEAAMGGRAGAGRPDTSWLPAQNPLRHQLPLSNALDAGMLRALLWVEPFGSFDSWALGDGAVFASCSTSTTALTGAMDKLEDLSRRIQALADPTRLLILRLIRNRDASNTGLASYLDLARPTVSIHAKILREAGLITTTSAGRAVRHHIQADAIRSLFRELEQLLDLPEISED
ncbi:winged helix-turn-helix transcriptional regulator [Chloroflexia bacterium SDU3-3]|nr:winged helix-turn-helix transcriptional regulator [Chloroflexia bacterium SDU3-3]